MDDESVGLATPGHITALRALMILSELAAAPDSMNLTQIATALRLPRPTVYRVLRTLDEEGWVIPSGSPRRYSAALRVAELGFLAARSSQLRTVLLPHAQRLAAQLQRRTTVAAYERGAIVYLDAFEPLGNTIGSLLLGSRVPAASTPAGRLLLAFRPADERVAVFEASAGELHVPPADEFKELTQLLREQRYTISERGDRLDRGIAVPVFDRAGDAVGVLGVTSHDQLTPDVVSEWVTAAQVAAMAASAELGYHSHV